MIDQTFNRGHRHEDFARSHATYCDKDGNKGFTWSVIETSNVISHGTNSVHLVQLDVYTGIRYYYSIEALDKWDPTKIDYKYLDRETNQLRY